MDGHSKVKNQRPRNSEGKKSVRKIAALHSMVGGKSLNSKKESSQKGK